jgi:trafficking protein particle complex subunit 10
VASNIHLYHDRDVNQPTNRPDDLLRAPRITIYHRSHTLDVQLTASKHIQLDKNNTVDIDLNSGWNDLISAEVRIKAATGGLRLVTAEAKCVNESLDFSKPPEAGLFSFGRIPSQTNVKIRFPYTVETEVLHVTIRIEVSYKTEHGSFMFSRTPSVPISLALGVNVQDVFKHKALLSRFTVSTASPSPLRLFRSELVGSDIFESKFGLPPGKPALIFPRQPSSLLYKITRKKGLKLTAKTQRTMYLKLHYSIVQNEIAEAFDAAITDALKNTPLHMYSRLLVDSLIAHIEKDLSALELERAAVLGAVSTAFLCHINWTPHLGGLGKGVDGKDLCSALASFVKMWQSQNQSLELPQTVPSEPKSILIPVDIPSIGIVHTANISLEDRAITESPYPGALTMNQLVPATLHLKWTRIWDTGTPLQEMADLEFSYEVTSPGDAWLIGGRRKGHFVIPAPSSTSDNELSSTDETEADIPLLLMPQRDGWITYPNVDIGEVRGGGLASQGGSLAGSGGVTPVEADVLQHCETDLCNLGETIRVVTDRNQVTLSLDASGPGGGPLVLAVEGRGRVERVVA